MMYHSSDYVNTICSCDIEHLSFTLTQKAVRIICCYIVVPFAFLESYFLLYTVTRGQIRRSLKWTISEILEKKERKKSLYNAGNLSVGAHSCHGSKDVNDHPIYLSVSTCTCIIMTCKMAKVSVKNLQWAILKKIYVLKCSRAKLWKPNPVQNSLGLGCQTIRYLRESNRNELVLCHYA